MNLVKLLIENIICKHLAEFSCTLVKYVKIFSCSRKFSKKINNNKN